MKGNRLYKYEKLRSCTAISKLFGEGNNVYAYPLRAAYRISEATEINKAGCKFMITVPKKKMHHAVDRVWLRRRIREAYRLNRELIVPNLIEKGLLLEVAFLYLSTDKKDYHCIEEKMQAMLTKIAAMLEENTGENNAPEA